VFAIKTNKQTKCQDFRKKKVTVLQLHFNNTKKLNQNKFNNHKQILQNIHSMFDRYWKYFNDSKK